jgi:hypothetical protein
MKTNLYINKTKRIIKVFLVLVAFIFVSACSLVPLTDISNTPEAAKLIGEKVKTKKEIYKLGISSDDNVRPAKVDKVYLKSRGSGSRFTLTEEIVGRDTVFEIIGVFEGIHWFVKIVEGRRFSYQVIEVGAEIPEIIPMYIYSVDIKSSFDDSNLGLNPEYYEVVK